MKKYDDTLALTVKELVAHGVETVEAHCNFCGKSWPAPIGVMPDATTLWKVRALLACPTCDQADIDVEPNWPDAPSAH